MGLGPDALGFGAQAHLLQDLFALGTTAQVLKASQMPRGAAAASFAAPGAAGLSIGPVGIKDFVTVLA
jgi:hypothetical protein